MVPEIEEVPVAPVDAAAVVEAVDVAGVGADSEVAPPSRSDEPPHATTSVSKRTGVTAHHCFSDMCDLLKVQAHRASF